MEDLYYRKPKQRRLFSRLKKRRVILVLAAGVFVFGYALFGSHGIVQRVRLEKEKEDLKAKIEAAEEENDSLRAESKALDSDLKAIEKVAREKYGMSRDGETVYRIKKKE